MCIKWYENKLKKIRFWDMQAVKLSTGMFALVVGAFLADYIKPYWYVFIVIMILAMAKVLYKVFK